MVAPGGHAWLLRGGRVWLLVGGMHGCSRGGGVRGFFDEIRSMSGQYASYWNAFLFYLQVVGMDCCPSLGLFATVAKDECLKVPILTMNNRLCY